MTLCHTKMVALTQFIFVQIKGFFFKGAFLEIAKNTSIIQSINQSLNWIFLTEKRDIECTLHVR